MLGMTSCGICPVTIVTFGRFQVVLCFQTRPHSTCVPLKIESIKKRRFIVGVSHKPSLWSPFVLHSLGECVWLQHEDDPASCLTGASG